MMRLEQAASIAVPRQHGIGDERVRIVPVPGIGLLLKDRSNAPRERGAFLGWPIAYQTRKSHSLTRPKLRAPAIDWRLVRAAAHAVASPSDRRLCQTT
jgi:hypothetical protein